jgi:ribonuclease R
VIKEILYNQEKADAVQTTANDGHYDYPMEAVVELGEHCSLTERRADDATRDVSDWLKCEFMQDHVGDNFTGVISTVTNFGMFVRLQDLHIEGLVHITSLGRDFYHYDDVRMCLTGEQSGKKYRVGDEIRVQVAAVNLDEKKIDLRLEGSEVEENQGQFKGKSKGKSKSTSVRRSGSKPAEGKSETKTKNQATTAKKDKPKSKPKAGSKDKPKETSKAKKRSARKKRPGKNARKGTATSA